MPTSRLRLLSLLPALALLCIGAACGGGEDGRVGIRHIDFTGVELSYVDVFDPPFADQYPAVVAEVNGEPITGEALAAHQVMLELGRRQAIDIDFELLRGQFLTDIESTEPLEALIDEALKRQAVERLGLLPTYDEAVEYTRQQEDAFLQPRGAVSPEKRAEQEELLRLSGMPEQNWASDREVVERYRQMMGWAALQNIVCEQVRWQTPAVLSLRHDCQDFLQQERQDADIRYFVKWVD